MDQVILSIGETDVTALQVLLGLGAATVIALVVLIIIVQVGGRRRIDEAAQSATSALRASFDQQLAERDNRARDLARELDTTRQANAKLQADNARLTALMQERDRQNEANLKRFEAARAQMTDEFKAIAGDVLKSHSETFSKQNKQQVDTLLAPLREKINEFQKEAVQGRTQLTEQLKLLAEDSLQMRTEAQHLTRALKGNAQTQGAWGEMILSTVLERSGLVEGEHFFTQQSYSDERGRARTDVEVLLPGGKGKLIVDSKVSLTAFETFTNTDDPEIRNQSLRDHVQSLRNHVRTLGTKDYHRRAGSDLDYVVMFVPIEGAFSLALQHDAALVDFAFSQGVSISTPTTLLSMLRTVSNIWDVEKRQKNAEEIADRAGRLYDKVVGFLTSMDRIEKGLDTAQSEFGKAKSQLKDGAGSVVRQVEMLHGLGAKASKKLPAGWDDDQGADDLNLLESDGDSVDDANAPDDDVLVIPLRRNEED